MRNASRAVALTAAVSLGAIAATSSPTRAFELGPVTIYAGGGLATIINNSTDGYYVFDFDVGNSSPGGAYVDASTSQPNWQAVVNSSFDGYNIITIADYLSLGSLSDDIAPGERSSNFTYYSNQFANLYTVSLVNAAGETEFYSGFGAPEASTWAMMLLGFAGLSFAASAAPVKRSWRWRRRPRCPVPRPEPAA